MKITELSKETLEELCYALEKCPTLDWKVLMRWFHSLYSEEHIATIQCSKIHPAEALLDDLDHREIPLQVLVDGLNSIGNKKAVSIIKKGAQKSGLHDIQYSGDSPPVQFSAAHPQECKDIHFSWAQRRERAETLPFPVQESEATEGACHPSDPGHEAPLNLVDTVLDKFSSCFSFYYKTS